MAKRLTVVGAKLVRTLNRAQRISVLRKALGQAEAGLEKYLADNEGSEKTLQIVRKHRDSRLDKLEVTH